MKHEKVLTKPLRKLEETKARQYSFSRITIHLELVVLSDGLLWLFFFIFFVQMQNIIKLYLMKKYINQTIPRT